MITISQTISRSKVQELSSVQNSEQNVNPWLLAFSNDEPRAAEMNFEVLIYRELIRSTPSPQKRTRSLLHRHSGHFFLSAAAHLLADQPSPIVKTVYFYETFDRPIGR
jgi:hypothetical protein